MNIRHTRPRVQADRVPTDGQKIPWHSWVGVSWSAEAHPATLPPNAW
jgi:hypothetical protein